MNYSLWIVTNCVIVSYIYLPVVDTDTVIDVWTMMIKYFHTSVTHSTMFRT